MSPLDFSWLGEDAAATGGVEIALRDLGDEGGGDRMHRKDWGWLSKGGVQVCSYSGSGSLSSVVVLGEVRMGGVMLVPLLSRVSASASLVLPLVMLVALWCVRR